MVDAVLSASRVLVAVAARSLADVAEEVTLTQYRTLIVLASRGPQNLAGLAEAVGVTPATATRMCDRLVTKGLIRRRAEREDRRQLRAGADGDGPDARRPPSRTTPERDRTDHRARSRSAEQRCAGASAGAVRGGSGRGPRAGLDDWLGPLDAETRSRRWRRWHGGCGAQVRAGRWLASATYTRKWLVLGASIGVIAGLGAVVFFEALRVATYFCSSR